MLSLLQSINTHSKALLTLLKQEKQALDHHNFEQLNQLASSKQNLLDKLQLLDTQREKKISPPHKQGHKQKKQNSDESFTAYIASTRILRKQSQLNLEMLSVLTGANQQHSAQTYTADGVQSTHSSLFNGVKA